VCVCVLLYVGFLYIDVVPPFMASYQLDGKTRHKRSNQTAVLTGSFDLILSLEIATCGELHKTSLVFR
jgi:hypothetical protein